MTPRDAMVAGGARTPFLEALAERRAATGATLCVGLDPDPARIPRAFGEPGVASARAFLDAAIEATGHAAAAYKPNAAFFEAMGREGWRLLADTIASARRRAPVILDAKRGDIGNTAQFYGVAAFDELGADALTINPLLGSDSIEPFFAWRDRGLFVLCATSNPGAEEFLLPGGFAERIVAAREAWATRHPAVGLVVGATRASLLAELAARAEHAPMLVPGLGAQGGEAAIVGRLARVRAAPLIVNVARAILYPTTPEVPSGDRSGGASGHDAARHAAAIHAAATRWLESLRDA